MEAEHERAKEEGGEIARSAVGLLRFFAPPASSLRAVCPIAPLGFQIVPLAKTIIFGEGTFSYTEGVLPGVSTHWQLSNNHLVELQEQGLTTVADLVDPGDLGDFALAVRSSVLLFSAGMTFPDILNRLVHTFSSMERLLLRHSAEPTEFTVGQRIVFYSPRTQPRASRSAVTSARLTGCGIGRGGTRVNHDNFGRSFIGRIRAQCIRCAADSVGKCKCFQQEAGFPRSDRCASEHLTASASLWTSSCRQS